MCSSDLRTEIVPHVLYEDSIHGELPRARVRQMIDRHGIEHIELQPGDAVCWHASLWHYSPINPSPRGRIGIAGVFTTPQRATRSKRSWGSLPWVMRDGRVCAAFPVEEFEVPEEGREPAPPFMRADSVGA